jgi:hypothetical protein
MVVGGFQRRRLRLAKERFDLILAHPNGGLEIFGAAPLAASGENQHTSAG